MPKYALIFGILLIALGLFGYFGSDAEAPSITALIPAFVGIPLVLCGLIGFASEGARKHAMHAAAVIGLLGALAGLGRGLSKVGVFFAEDPEGNRRATALALTMGVLSAIFVGMCVKSFMDARRSRQAAKSSPEKAPPSDKAAS